MLNSGVTRGECTFNYSKCEHRKIVNNLFGIIRVEMAITASLKNVNLYLPKFL